MASTHEPHPAPVQESAMDYAEHEKTYSGFIAGVKYSIISIAIMVIGLYFSIIGDQPLLGIVLILASLVVPVVMAFLARK